MNLTQWALPAIFALLALVIGFIAGALAPKARLKQQARQVQEQQQQLDELKTQLAASEQQRQQQALQAATSERTVESLRERLNELFESQKMNAQKLDQAQRDYVQVSNTVKSQQTELQLAQQRMDEVKEERDEARQHAQQYQQQVYDLKEQVQVEQANLTAKQQQLQEQQQQFEQQRQALKTEFKVLSESILKERGEALREQNKDGVGAILKPLQEQIDAFQKRVNEVHSDTIKGNTNLEAEIKKVMEVGLKMREDASNLTSALKGDSQQRGAWGEAQLERTLEMSGLLEDAHYEKQTAFVDKEGKQKRTDYLVKLPDNKQIIIDSKVSLVAYDEMVGAQTEEAYQTALQRHIHAVRRHIDDLSSKDYTNLIGVRSPSFVLMFMPIEPAYIEALKHNKDLFSYGYEKGVVLVSHTTLIPILRTVANLWMMERSNQEAREISDQAGDIFNQVCTVAERLEKLGRSLSAVSNHYNKTVTSLAGKQGLYGKVERFNQLSSKVSKTLPELQPTHADFEAERLSMIAEPVADSAAAQEALTAQTVPEDPEQQIS